MPSSLCKRCNFASVHKLTPRSFVCQGTLGWAFPLFPCGAHRKRARQRGRTVDEMRPSRTPAKSCYGKRVPRRNTVWMQSLTLSFHPPFSRPADKGDSSSLAWHGTCPSIYDVSSQRRISWGLYAVEHRGSPSLWVPRGADKSRSRNERAAKGNCTRRLAFGQGDGFWPCS
jgi:hypothetical protein